jgi:hypothetical protein
VFGNGYEKDRYRHDKELIPSDNSKMEGASVLYTHMPVLEGRGMNKRTKQKKKEEKETEIWNRETAESGTKC